MESKIECLRIKGNARLELKQLILMGQLVGGEGQEVGGGYKINSKMLGKIFLGLLLPG